MQKVCVLFQIIKHFFLVYVPFTVILDILYIATAEEVDSIYLTDVGSVLCSNLFFAAYVLNVGINWKDVKNIFDELYKVAAPKDQASYQQLKSDADIVRSISVMITATGVGIGWGFLVVPGIQAYKFHQKFPNKSIEFPLIWHQWYPWDTNTHPFWEVSMVSELVRGVAIFYLFIGFDTMLSGFIVVVAGQFKLLQKYINDTRLAAECKISYLSKQLNEDETERAVATEMENLLRSCIKKHVKLIKYTNQNTYPGSYYY